MWTIYLHRVHNSLGKISDFTTCLFYRDLSSGSRKPVFHIKTSLMITLYSRTIGGIEKNQF